MRKEGSSKNGNVYKKVKEGEICSSMFLSSFISQGDDGIQSGGAIGGIYSEDQSHGD